jgi:hypothetical protein
VRSIPCVALAALLAATVLAGCSGNGKDSDQDTMYDTQEKNGWDVTVDTLTERTKHHTSSDPKDADTDGDGLPDNDEFFLGTDPRLVDTDGDGLTDCQEARHTNRTQCEDESFNGPFDGGYNTDPLKADSDPGVSLYVLNGRFTDHTGTLANGQPATGDGISDGEELAGYTIHLANGNARTVKTDPRNADSDGDHLDDGEERFLYASDPTVADTDGDGCVDGLDPLPAMDEHYDLGLRSFTLKGSSSSVQLRLTVLVANSWLDVPKGSTVTAQNGQSTDLRSVDPAPVHSDECTYTPRHPWVKMQVLAYDASAQPPRLLDLSSGVGGTQTTGQGATFWWNVADASFSWSDGGADPVTGSSVSLTGADGLLVLQPAVVQAA